jgi:cyclopropane fatty-acyl-phospholipid synthase-like methyltransferase
MNQWNIRFQDEDYVYGSEPNVFLADIQIKLQLSGDTLAIAEGEGRNAVFLAEQGMKVTAWDYAESGLSKTKKLADSRGVTVSTELVDLNDVNWEKEKWDQLVCISGIFQQSCARKHSKALKKRSRQVDIL